MASNTLTNQHNENLMRAAYMWAVRNKAGDEEQVMHYPLFCYEVLKGRSWEQIRKIATHSYLGSLAPRKKEIFVEEFLREASASESHQFLEMERRILNHYSRTLHSRLTKADPKKNLRDWATITAVNPHLDGIPEPTRTKIEKKYPLSSAIRAALA